LTYGGIDSDGTVNRVEEITSIMSQVALAHAAEGSCNIVLADFARDDGKRVLFNDVSKFDSTALVDTNTFDVTAYGSADSTAYVIESQFEAGNYNIVINYMSEAFLRDIERQVQLMVDKFVIKTESGSVLGEYQAGDITDFGGYFLNGNTTNREFTGADIILWDSSPVVLPLIVDKAQKLRIEVYAFKQIYITPEDGGDWTEVPEETNLYGETNMKLSIQVNNTLVQNTAIARKVKEKIIELIDKFWGTDVSINSKEVDLLFNLFEQSRLDKFNRTDRLHIREDNVICDIDWKSYDTVEAEGWHIVGDDPEYMMSAWRTVVAFLMSDYRFIHE